MFDAEKVFIKQRRTGKGLQKFLIDLFFVVFELINYNMKLENKDNDTFFQVQLNLVLLSAFYVT